MLRRMDWRNCIAYLAALGCGGALPASRTDSASGTLPAASAPVAEQRPVSRVSRHDRGRSLRMARGGWRRCARLEPRENAHTRALLDALPRRAELTARVRELLTASPDWYTPRWRGGRLFMIEDRPPKQQPYLVTLTKPEPSGAHV